MVGWFYPVRPLPTPVRIAADYVRAAGRLSGSQIRLPGYCPLGAPERMAALSPAVVTELETHFDEIEQELGIAVGEQLRGCVEGRDFELREGLDRGGLLAAAEDIGASYPNAIVAFVVGSSSPTKRCSKPNRPSMTRCGWPAPCSQARR
jgi:hypothetical protein